MRSFKIKKVVAFVLLCIMLIVTEMILSYLLTPISYADYFNHDIEQIKKNNEDVSMIFVGASRTYRSFVPSIFEEKIGGTVINAGSSSQPISATYYQSKELIKEFHPQYLILGVTYDQLISEDSTQGKLIVCDRLKSPIIKGELAVKSLRGTEKLYLLNSYRFKDNLSVANIKQYLDDKKELRKRDYMPDKQANEYYADNGFVYSNQCYENGNIAISGSGEFEETKINHESVEYMDKIVRLCEEKNVKLFLVTGPTTMMRIYNTKNYQEADDFYHRYAAENNLVYHNLNLIKDRENILPDEFMHDYNHVNGKGAELVSEIYAEILQESISGENTDHYFYSSVAEMKQNVHRVVAVGAEIQEKDNELVIDCYSLQNADAIPEYQVLISKAGEQYEIVVDYTEENHVVIELEDDCDCKIRINARCKNEENMYVAFQDYDI